MPDALIQIGETCGMEIECDFLPRDTRISGYRSLHDASCESDVLAINGGEFFVERNMDADILERISYANFTIGTEFASEIMNSSSDNFLPAIKRVTKFLSENGESPTSDRSGIHFHFSLDNPSLRILKSLLRLGRFLESVFFSVGGMGYTFRGVKNDSTYCRPITEYGPPCVPLSSGFAQCFNLTDVLKSKTIEEFWNLYGDLYHHNSRYTPVRYLWLNLYPLFTRGEYRGTVEFRIFNRSLNPMFIYSAAMLCKHFVNYAMGAGFNELREENLLKNNSIYKNQNVDEVTRTLEKFAELVNMDSDLFANLSNIIYLSGVPRLEKRYVYSHLIFSRGGLGRFWDSYNYNPKLIGRSDIFKPDYTDIHVLRGEH